MSGLRRFQCNPKILINTAMHMYRSKKIRTVVVEGVCDKRFLSQWTGRSKPIRFDGFDGKKIVEDVYKLSLTPHYGQYSFLLFFADTDYDVIHKIPLINCTEFVYNAYCFESNRSVYNDLETFLINTRALEKVMANLDLDPSEADIVRQKLEKASREIGAFRAADDIVRKKFLKKNSILNGIEPSVFFDARLIQIDTQSLIKALPKWANYREHVDDLVECAKSLNTDNTAPWVLSRGHDITEMLCEHFTAKGAKGLSREKVELMLRLACELETFRTSPMGKRLVSADVDQAFFGF